MPTKLPPDKEIGRTLFLQNCWQCHGKAGLGDGPLAEQLGPPTPIQRAFTGEAAENDAIAIIQEGRNNMPAFSQVFDRADSKRILQWLTAVAGGEDPDAAAPVPEKSKAKIKEAKGAKEEPEAAPPPKPEDEDATP